MWAVIDLSEVMKEFLGAGPSIELEDSMNEYMVPSFPLRCTFVSAATIFLSVALRSFWLSLSFSSSLSRSLSLNFFHAHLTCGLLLRSATSTCSPLRVYFM
jgi:hypothetical protein